MQKKEKMQVLWNEIAVLQNKQDDYICLTDIARYKSEKTEQIIQNWLRNRNTIEFLWLREKLNYIRIKNP